jgi:hypothetical protein
LILQFVFLNVQLYKMPYESVYNVNLLDDIHNYFPALLYNNRQFQGVQDVFQYVNAQMDFHFNTYNRQRQLFYGEPMYTSPPTQPRQPQQQPPEPTTRETQQYPSTLFTTPRRPSNESRPAPNAPSRPGHTLRPATFYTESAPPSTDFVTETYDLTPLFNATVLPPLQTPLRPLGYTSTQSILTEFMNLLETLPRISQDSLTPVVVRPSTEQIEAATTQRAATSDDEPNMCTVCQDTYTEGQAIRQINNCNHTFHKNCIDHWFEQNVHCPVCRHDIREEDQANQTSSDASQTSSQLPNQSGEH